MNRTERPNGEWFENGVLPVVLRVTGSET